MCMPWKETLKVATPNSLTPQSTRRGWVQSRPLLRMLLPNPIDQLTEIIGRGIAKLRQWSPVGLRVVLMINEGPQLGATLSGTVRALSEKHDSGAVIELDIPWNLEKRRTRWILAMQRYDGHGVYRLLVTSCVVNVNALDSETVPESLSNEQFVAIADMRCEG